MSSPSPASDHFYRFPAPPELFFFPMVFRTRAFFEISLVAPGKERVNITIGNPSAASLESSKESNNKDNHAETDP